MWQSETFERISGSLRDDDAVKQVIQLGSQSDEWSDLDIGVQVDIDAYDQFFPSTEWIAQFGDIYALNQSSSPHKGTSRVVFSDGSRVDFSISTDKSLLSTDAPAPSASGQAETLVGLSNDFKFEAFLATTKVARDDLLIGLHLILELERKCLVVAMMLRDRELGTTHHRSGGPYNQVIAELGSHGNSREDLLARMLIAVRLFEKLSQQLNPIASQDWQPLEHYEKRVRASVQN